MGSIIPYITQPTRVLNTAQLVGAHLVPSYHGPIFMTKMYKKRVETKGFYTFPLQTTRRNPQNDGALEKVTLLFKYGNFTIFWVPFWTNFLGKLLQTHPLWTSIFIPGRPIHEKNHTAFGSLPSFPFLGPMGGDNFPLKRGKETNNNLQHNSDKSCSMIMGT